MRKLLDSLRYGDRDTKIYLWSMLLLSASTVLFGVLAILRLSFLFGFISVISAIIAAVLFQNTSLRDKELGEQAEKPPAKEQTGEEASRIEHYSEKQLVQIMRKHKVKRDNRKVMIDLCTAFRIRQSPAYFWAEAGKANFLVLEEEPRVIQIPLNKMKEITYERGVAVRKKQDYIDFKAGGFVTQVFEELMPTYYMAMKNGKQGYFKNLYSITPDLKVTNTSARALFDILKLDFGLHDAVTNSQRYSEYYKMAYKANVLWKDQVIDSREYRERIKEIFSALREMGIRGSQYDELVEQMVEGKLITREYAEYYKKLQ